MPTSRTYYRSWERGSEVLNGEHTISSDVGFDIGEITVASGADEDIAISLDVSEVTDLWMMATQDMTVRVNATNEVQSITPTGTISGGTTTFTYSGQTTSAIAHNATAADIQAALEALSNIGVDDVAVTGGPLNTDVVYVEFRGALAATNVSQLTHTPSLTGGGSLGIATDTAGVAAAQTIELLANVPYEWLDIEAAYRSLFFTSDWTKLLVSNNGEAPGTFVARGGYDV